MEEGRMAPHRMSHLPPSVVEPNPVLEGLVASTAGRSHPHLGSSSSGFGPTPPAPPVHEHLPKGGGTQSVLSVGFVSS